MIDRFLGDAFGVLSCQFWSAVLQVVLGCRYTLKLLDRAITDAQLLTGGVFESDIVCCIRSCVTRCTVLNGAIPGPHVPVLVTCGGLVAHTSAHILKYTYAPPRCRTLQYSRTFISLSMFLWNDIAAPVFHGLGLAVFKSTANVF